MFGIQSDSQQDALVVKDSEKQWNCLICGRESYKHIDFFSVFTKYLPRWHHFRICRHNLTSTVCYEFPDIDIFENKSETHSKQS